MCPVAYSSLVNVRPNTGYIIKFEILQNNLKVSNIKVNDKDFGNCDPSVEAAEDCKFYDCSDHLDWKYVSSTNGVMFFEWTYSEHSQKCECDKESWECGNNLNTGSQIIDAARIELTPIGK